MSFSVDLWNGFSIIKEEIYINHRNLKDVLNIIILYYNLQNQYYKDLENLSKIINEKRVKIQNSFISNIVDSFIQSFMKESEIYKKNLDNLNKNINDIKKEYDTINIQIANYLNENIYNKESFNNILENLIIKKEEYSNSCDELSNYIAEMEALKIMRDNINFNENQYNEKKNNLIIKTIEIKKEYILAIEEGEKGREIYNKITEELLTNLQKRFKDIIYFIHRAINFFIKEKINTYNEIIELSKQNDELLYSAINYRTETNNFIIKNVTKMFPLTKLEFVPYKINLNEINKKLNQFNELSQQDKKNINNFIINIFKQNSLNINEDEFINIISNRTKSSTIGTLNRKDSFIKSNSIFINDFIFKLCNSSELNIEKKQNITEERHIYNNLLFRFMDLISINNKEHFEYLKVFIKLLNYYRSKGFFILKEYSYQIFINIFSFILVNYKTSDNLIKNIILLAQTFYKVDEKTNKKIYLLSGLKNHDTFNNADTWHRVINHNLSFAMRNNKNYNLDIINKEEYLKYLNKIVTNSIISYLYDLKLSTSQKSVYEDVKKFYCIIYKLDENEIDNQVNKLFEEENDNDKRNFIQNKIDNENQIEKKIEIENQINEENIMDKINEINEENKIKSENEINDINQIEFKYNNKNEIKEKENKIGNNIDNENINIIKNNEEKIKEIINNNDLNFIEELNKKINTKILNMKEKNK